MRPPIAEPRATESIDGDDRASSAGCSTSGHAYLTHGTVYFDVSTFPRFGELSHYSPRRDGASSPGRAAATPTIPHRRDPLDFVLWQPSLADEPAWRAPFGVGRPGLAHRVLGDVDARARPDARPARRRHRPHLPAPRVRDRAERERSPASRSSRHWLHSAMVSYEGEKMSKSLGNLVFVSDLLKVADPRAIRLALMRHHYRAGLRVARHRPRGGHRAAAPPARRGRAHRRRRPAPVRGSVCGPRSTTTSTRRARSRRSTTSPSAILSGGDDATAPGALRELGAPARHRPRPAARSPTDRRDNRRGARRTSAAGNVDRIMSAPDTITITLPDGSTPHELADGAPRRRGRGLDRHGARQGRGRGHGRRRVGRPRPPARPRRDASRSSRPNSDDGREVLRHSTAHVMAQAVTDLFPGAKYAIGPAIADGFYYDFELPDGQHFTDDDLERIEAAHARDREGRRAVRPRGVRPRRRPRSCSPTSRTSSEIIERVDPDDGRTTWARGRRRHRRVYRNPRADGSVAFVDLCRGPHVPSTKRLGAFKLTKVAGAYWRGDEKRPMLQRIYGTAWESKKALDGAPAPARGGRAARPPQARRRARPLLVPGGDRLRARGVPPEGRASSASSWRTTRASATRRRATSS